MNETLDSSPQSELRTVSIAEGDRAAARGDWPDAVGIWHALLESDQREAATQRIRWFLGEVESGKTVFRRRGPGSRLVLAIAFVCGMFATLAVLVAQGVGGTAATALASAAWLLYAVSASLAVVYAWRTGQPTNRRPIDLTSGEIAHAALLAKELDASRSDG